MKKVILLALSVLLSIHLMGQEWESIKVEGIAEFSMPMPYSTTDTMGQRMYVAQLGELLYIVSIIKDISLGKVGSVDDLEEQYDSFLDGMTSSMPEGKILEKKMITNGNIHGLQSKILGDIAGGMQTIQFTTYAVSNTQLSFQIVSETADELALKEFNSTVQFVPDLTFDDQLNETDLAYQAGRLFGILLLVGVIVFGVVYSNRKKKKAANAAENNL
jgi:hypothetical protein